MERGTSKISLDSSAPITTTARTLAEVLSTPETEDRLPRSVDISSPVPDSPSPICSSSSDQISPRISNGFWSQLIPNSVSGSENDKFQKMIERLHRMRIKNNVRLGLKENSFSDFNEENPRLDSTDNCEGYFELEPRHLNYLNPEKRCISSCEIQSETHSQLVPPQNDSSNSTDDLNSVIIHEEDDEIDQWQNAKQAKYMNRLKKKEDGITNWESKKTEIALEKIKKVEMKMDIKKARTVEKIKRKMDSLQERAEAMKVKERKSAMKKVSGINKISDRIRSTKSRALAKILKLF